ncbi:MAG: DNA double-strand break repair nuclease NurA [Chloroflexota bacterium]
MTLDLLDVSTQISTMAAGMQQRRHSLWRALGLAREVAASLSDGGSLAELRQVAREAAGERLVAEPVEPLGFRRPAGQVPESHTIVGTDGSQIDLDRHGLAPCYLINVGSAVVAYGAQPAASLTSHARLHYADDDGGSPEGEARIAVQGSMLDLHRTLAEQQRALELARGVAAREAAGPLLVLMDGTLVVWRFSGRGAERAAPIMESYLAGLRAFQRAGIPLCSYVSRPAARDLVTLLSLAGPRMAGGNSGAHDTPYAALRVLQDRLLFDDLPPGTRSSLCASTAPGLEDGSDEQRIHFFYLNVGSEVGRVEVPGWVAADPRLLDLVHTLVVDQCRLGWGYPVVLSEAHEQAVVRGGEREAFLRMVSTALNDHGLAASLSLKRLSKNRRAV